MISRTSLHNWLGARQIQDTGYVAPEALHITPSGEILVTGDYGDGDLGRNGKTHAVSVAGSSLPSYGWVDPFVAKFSDTGNGAQVIWAYSLGGGGSADRSAGIGTDSSGSIYVGGTVYGTEATIGGVTIPGETNRRKPFVVKLSESSETGRPEVNWVRSLDTDATETFPGAPLVGFAVGQDQSGVAIYATGMFSSTIDFDPGTETQSRTARTSDSESTRVEGFVLRLSGSGDYQQVWQFGSRVDDATVDGNGNVHLAATLLSGDLLRAC